ncbi:MAG: prephenate dehydratase [bacterium]
MSERLDELREQIDEIDSEIVKQLEERARVVKEVGEIKKEHGMELYVPEREREILDRLEERSEGEFPVQSLKQIFREIIATCLNLEKPVTVAYLGPEATFTHSAALKQFGRASEFVPLETVSEVFDFVEREDVDFGIVPIESSSEGAVRHTLDRFLESSLSIYSECFLMVDLHLIGRCEDRNDITTVYSHPQALAQSRDWIDRYLHDVEIQETNSTAEAARIVSERDDAAAVASEVAAEVYDLNTMASNIETEAESYTRFLVLSRQVPEPTGNDKTTIAFSVMDRPGALYEMLEPFGEREINMTKIESRPSRHTTWDYTFFVDFIGHQQEEEVEELLSQLKSRSKYFKVLGSYPYQDPFN